jgi:FolB domain-containing protein
MPVQRLSQPYPFSLAIDTLAVPVHLGVTAEEQEQAQTVYVDLRLYYPTIPDAKYTDSVQYLCYDGLCQSLLEAARRQPVALIEFLLGELYRTARAQVPAEVKIHMALHKPLPQALVGYTVKGATVEYTDLPEGLR